MLACGIGLSLEEVISMVRQGQGLSTSAKNICRKLELQFSGEIYIISNSLGKFLIVPGNLSIRYVVLENENLS